MESRLPILGAIFLTATASVATAGTPLDRSRDEAAPVYLAADDDGDRPSDVTGGPRAQSPESAVPNWRVAEAIEGQPQVASAPAAAPSAAKAAKERHKKDHKNATTSPDMTTPDPHKNK